MYDFIVVDVRNQFLNILICCFHYVKRVSICAIVSYSHRNQCHLVLLFISASIFFFFFSFDNGL